MGKITIKHFLNTNLKPYIINKQNYYSVYLLITAQRKTTKVKSIVFDEYYSESDFESIFNSNDSSDKNMIDNEINSVNIISELIINELKEFDTNFFTAYYNFSNTIDIWKTDNQIFSANGNKIDLYDASKNSAGIVLDSFKNEFTDIRGVSIFEFFNKDNQKKALQILKTQNIKNPEVQFLVMMRPLLLPSRIRHLICVASPCMPVTPMTSMTSAATPFSSSIGYHLL